MKMFAVLSILILFTLSQTVFAAADDRDTPLPEALLPDSIGGFIIEESDGFALVESADGFQVRLRLDFAYIIDGISGRPMTLADRVSDYVIAYYGPGTTRGIPPESDAILMICNVPEGTMPPLFRTISSVVESIREGLGTIHVTIDGRRVDFDGQNPVIEDGRVLVPVRGVFEQLGFVVSWDGGTRQVTLTNDDYMISLTIGSALFTVNGANHVSDVPAQIIGGRTMLPIRAVLESAGYGLDWDEASRTVLILSEYI